MRARLSAISNFTTSQLLTILQNWTTNTSEIIVDGQMLIMTSAYFLQYKNKAILFSPIGSVGGLSFFLCVCCIIIVCIFKMFKSKRKYKLKTKFVF